LEGFHLTAKNAAGDTLELTAFRYEEWSTSVETKSKTENSEKTNLESSDKMQELWKAVQRELKGQQRDLLRRLLEGSENRFKTQGGEVGSEVQESFRRLTVLVLEEKYAKGEESQDGDSESELDIDPYWNAENTSDRIVQFAMGFAALHGKEEEFGDRIRAAVEEGFRQAGALTGPLPGAAGKLNQSTHTLTFEKLELRLVEAKARAYNQVAQTIPMTA
jgi:hypothetical protein